MALRDPFSKAYKKINALMTKKGEPLESQMVFSDVMYKFDVSLNKVQMIVLVTDSSLFVLNSYYAL